MSQLDLIRHSDASLAKAYRTAAETAMHNPYITVADCETRAAYYLTLAAKHEAPDPDEVPTRYEDRRGI
jgi:hypothetical protein